MKSAMFRSLVLRSAVVALIAASCSDKQEEAKRPENPVATAKEASRKDAPSTLSSPPPVGQWKAVEEKSEGAPVAITVHFSRYTSPADVQAVAQCATPSQCKARIQTFDSLGGLQVGQQLSTKDGKTMVIGQFWSPNFVTARLSGETWKLTVVSGSPYGEKAKAEDVGVIELTMPVNGDGGSARLYMATAVAIEKGQLVAKTPTSEAKLLKITSYVPSEEKK